MRTTLPIALGFYTSDSLPLSAQRAVNWRPSVPQTATITDANLFSTEGIVGIIEGIVTERCRGAHVLAGIPYFVIGSSLYRLERTISVGSASYSTVSVGTIAGDSDVYMADNGTQLCIVAIPDLVTAGKSYIFTTSPDTLTEITDVNFDGPASSVIFVDGYFIFHKSDGKKFFNSPLNNGLTGYDPLDFNVAEADPDQIRGLGVLNSQLYVLGSETTQVFRNVGRAPSPFSPVVGATIDLGVFAPRSIVRFSGGLAFVGGGVDESPAVWLISGGQRRKLSTIAIENELSKLSVDIVLTEVSAWVYAESGAYMMGILTPTTCFVYDITNDRWHERQSIVGTDLGAYRVSHIVTAYGETIVGDNQSGNIGILSEDEYLEYEVLVPRIITSRPFDNSGNALNVASIEAVIEAGIGLSNDVRVKTGVNASGSPVYSNGGSDPKITLSWSDDGGRTFEGFISRSMGKIGEYTQRPTWNRLGRFSRQRVLQFEVSSPTKSTLIKVEAEIG
jgi:hypothetical protein